MAKKSTATRQTNAARRPQTTGKQTSVALVRAPHPEQQPSSGVSPEMRAAKPAEAARKPMVVAPAEKPRAPELTSAPKPAPKPAAAAAAKPAPQASRDQATRIARARAMQSARAANIISPERYAYVINDLKLIAGLAFSMFAIVVILHFVLPPA